MLAGLLIGIIFPLIINFLAFKSIRLQATQSATGLLYVSIVSILFGDLIFKFYLLQYGFTLWIRFIVKNVKNVLMMNHWKNVEIAKIIN